MLNNNYSSYFLVKDCYASEDSISFCLDYQLSGSVAVGKLDKKWELVC